MQSQSDAQNNRVWILLRYINFTVQRIQNGQDTLIKREYMIYFEEDIICLAKTSRKCAVVLYDARV